MNRCQVIKSYILALGHHQRKVPFVYTHSPFCIYSKPSVSEAPCRSQILTAQAVRDDFGDERSSSAGISAWANLTLTNSERDVHRVVKKQHSTLNITVDVMTIRDQQIPWIPPRKWIEFLLQEGLWCKLAGLNVEDRRWSGVVWSQFWAKYKVLHPSFALFDMQGIDYTRTAAILLHGDEGRTLKKGGLMVTSIQSVLGMGYDNKRLKRNLDGSMKLKVNYANHTFTSRFVTSILPKSVYESNPEIFYDMMRVVSENLRDILLTGVKDPVTGEVFRVCLISAKGDWPYLSKLGQFTRSFNTAPKRSIRGQEVLKGTCHLCLAGTRSYPAEEIATSTPRWVETIGVLAPWVVEPSVVSLSCHDLENPASFFQIDLWHTVHLGFGRSFIASTVQLVLDVLVLNNLDEKWSFLTRHYLGWCKKNKCQAHISKVTAYLMSYHDRSGAQGNWHKGALTTNFMKWIVVLLEEVPKDRDGLLQLCLKAAHALNRMFGFLYQAPAFLEGEQCLFVADRGQEFLNLYYALAQSQFAKRKPFLYPLYPKLHGLHHWVIQLRGDYKNHQLAENPMIYACQMDEDCIGRVARLSRRVNIRAVMNRTFDRYLIAAHTVWVASGWLKG